ncbi:MAG: AAA family ATPase [Desulfobacula sp.]|nr:AAA family ATPase [Desulfobacula sp.]
MFIIQTITFYSYKGGVGRTLALANIAIYLSRFGQNVCIIDFDLEAPGLHYKFPKLVKTNDIKMGLVDYIYEFTNNKVIPQSLKEFTLDLINPTASHGGVQLIPAGNFLFPEYWRKLASIDWHSLFYEEGSEGIPFFLELKEKIRKELDPDFVLIDSRTGITEMGGLCTSLLPDKVVFLIVNNRENIEGAHQILQSIQNIERFPDEKPIEVTFALTRIPYTNEKDNEKEIQIVKNIQSILNMPMENLENQLDIQDICILHSDRDLELSESLRVNQDGISKETLLLRDYLRLFSKIIPDNIILTKLDGILDEITTTNNVLEDPDKIQQELEGLVSSYPHSKSFEKLIDFYILRNVGWGKILGAFHELWNTFGIDSSKILTKYVSLFMKCDLSSWNKPDFELSIVEKYLKLNPEYKISIETKLAKAYVEQNVYRMALKHYIHLLNEVEVKNEILEEILNIFIEKKQYDDATKLFENYSDIIDIDLSLRVKKVKIMHRVGNTEEVKKLLDDNGITENTLFEKEPYLYLDIMEMLGKSEELDQKLNLTLNKTLMEDNPDKLYRIGKIYDRLGRGDEFKKKLPNNRYSHLVIRELEKRSTGHIDFSI